MPIDPTVRKAIILKVQELFVAVTEGIYGLEFSTVAIGPLSSQDNRVRYALGIVAGEERKSDLYPFKTALFDLHLEFRVTVNKGDPAPALMAEDVLGVVQQVMYDNQTIDGLAIKADEQGSEINQITYSDKAVDGMVTFEVHYRHNAQSVYSGDPSI